MTATDVNVSFWVLVYPYLVILWRIALIAAVGWLARHMLLRWGRRACERSGVDPTLRGFVLSALSWAILTLAGLMVLNEAGIRNATFTVVLGAAGLAISLALQGTLASLAAGVMLILFRPFDVGDLVVVAGQRGRVYDLGLFATRIQTEDNREVVVPNRSIFGSVIENLTEHPWIRLDLPLNLPASHDSAVVRRRLLDAVASFRGEEDAHRPEIVLLDYNGGATMSWVVRVWAPSEGAEPVREQALLAVKQVVESLTTEHPVENPLAIHDI